MSDAASSICVTEKVEEYCSHFILWFCRHQAHGVIAQYDEMKGPSNLYSNISMHLVVDIVTIKVPRIAN